jgi:hypothetical protein
MKLYVIFSRSPTGSIFYIFLAKGETPQEAAENLRKSAMVEPEEVFFKVEEIDKDFLDKDWHTKSFVGLIVPTVDREEPAWTPAQVPE